MGALPASVLVTRRGAWVGAVHDVLPAEHLRLARIDDQTQPFGGCVGRTLYDDARQIRNGLADLSVQFRRPVLLLNGATNPVGSHMSACSATTTALA
jgi:hypothetical protein